MLLYAPLLDVTYFSDTTGWRFKHRYGRKGSNTSVPSLNCTGPYALYANRPMHMVASSNSQRFLPRITLLGRQAAAIVGLLVDHSSKPTLHCLHMQQDPTPFSSTNLVVYQQGRLQQCQRRLKRAQPSALILESLNLQCASPNAQLEKQVVSQQCSAWHEQRGLCRPR